MTRISRSRHLLRYVFCFLAFCSCLPKAALAQSTIAERNAAEWITTTAILSRKIENGSTEEKRDALFETRNRRTEAASRLAIAALGDSDEIIRATAAGAVVFLSQTEAVSVLVPLLRDKAEFVRIEAAYALGEVGNPGATDRLLDLLQRDRIPEVRTAATIALGKIGEPSAVPALVSLLRMRATEENEFLRRASARSIGQIAQVLRTGKRRVVTPQNFLPEQYKDDSIPSGIQLIQQYPQFSSVIETLLSVVRNRSEETDIRREAAFALGAIGVPSARSILESATGSDDPYLAQIAREALRKMPK